jgi:uncharacterized protein (TIGR03790 family)
MPNYWVRTATAPALAAVALTCCTSAGAATPAEVLLLINDSSPTSVAVGDDYIQKRQIANVLHVNCMDSAVSQSNETMPNKDFLSEIKTPVAAALAANPAVNYIVLTRGIPIRVAGAPTGEAYSGQRLASLDGQLAALGYDTLPGATMIRFNDPGGFAIGRAWLNNYWNQTAPFSHAQFGGYLVTRLDGYSVADAKALVTRALKSEGGLGGGNILLDVETDFGISKPANQPKSIHAKVIRAEWPLSTWNGDMVHAGNDLTAAGIPVELAETTRFVGHQSNLLGYFSFGSNDDHFRKDAYHSLTFAPGAVGDTAVSTSARSFFRQSFGQSMIADLITQGITGVKGYTDEPLLQAVSSPTLVLGHFTQGYNLAESFYGGSRFVGWTDLVVGDPLTTPYPGAEAHLPPR